MSTQTLPKPILIDCNYNPKRSCLHVDDMTARELAHAVLGSKFHMERIGEGLVNKLSAGLDAGHAGALRFALFEVRGMELKWHEEQDEPIDVTHNDVRGKGIVNETPVLEETKAKAKELSERFGDELPQDLRILLSATYQARVQTGIFAVKVWLQGRSDHRKVIAALNAEHDLVTTDLEKQVNDLTTAREGYEAEINDLHTEVARLNARNAELEDMVNTSTIYAVVTVVRDLRSKARMAFTAARQAAQQAPASAKSTDKLRLLQPTSSAVSIIKEPAQAS